MTVADETLVAYLTKHPVFEGLTSQQLQQIAKFASQHEVPVGHRLFKRDDPATQFFVLREGSVTVEVPSIEGESLKIQTVSGGGLLGWSWLIPPYRWSFDARADTPSTIVCFDGEKLRDACERDAQLGYQLLKRFAVLMAERVNAARVTAMRHYAGV
jgi:CRP-like cAMP-binding protein